MAKDIGGTNGMHMSSGKNPFTGGGGKTPMPKTATSQAAHKTAAGTVGAFKSANSAMKGK